LKIINKKLLSIEFAANKKVYNGLKNEREQKGCNYFRSTEDVKNYNNSFPP